MDHATFLRTILASPADDGPRLVFADWLEEQGEPGRAEFIRVQVERAAGPSEQTDWCHHDLTWSVVCRGCVLRRRERSLFKDYGSTWFADAPGSYRSTGDNMEIHTAEGWRYTVTRGFISEARLTSAAFASGERPRCGDTNHFDDGTTIFTPCWFTGVAARLARSQPVTKIVLTDRRPADRTAVNGEWYWFRDVRGENGTESHLSSVIFDLLPGGTRNTIGLPFSTEAAARAALSAACVAYARKMATPIQLEAQC